MIAYGVLFVSWVCIRCGETAWARPDIVVRCTCGQTTWSDPL